MTKILLHLCCAPCSPWIISELKNKYEIVCFFYDPNIHPRAEYIFRLAEAKKMAHDLQVEFLEGEYDDRAWFLRTSGFENEAEQGMRCEICFDMRLLRTAHEAFLRGINIFTTVIPVSPHKDFLQVQKVGQKSAEKYDLTFLAQDWKKNSGYLQTTRLAKEMKLKRQNYCGCLYSQEKI